VRKSMPRPLTTNASTIAICFASKTLVLSRPATFDRASRMLRSAPKSQESHRALSHAVRLCSESRTSGQSRPATSRGTRPSCTLFADGTTGGSDGSSLQSPGQSRSHTVLARPRLADRAEGFSEDDALRDLTRQSSFSGVCVHRPA